LRGLILCGWLLLLLLLLAVVSCTNNMGGGGSKKRPVGESEGKILRLVMLGHGGVGKSALTIQFVQDKFIKDYDPTIEDSYRKQAVVDGKVVMLNVWDTAGQEEYEALQDGYIRDAEGFIIVYSVTDKTSFAAVTKYWRKILMIRDSLGEPAVILGNKCDLEPQREVLTLDGQNLAKTFGCAFMETSAKSRLRVDEGFHEVVRQIRLLPPKPVDKLGK